MKAAEFFTSLKSGQVLSGYLFEGEEEYSKESALRQLRAQCLKAPFESLNESVLTDPDVSTLIAVCETLPMMSEKRLVIVKESRFVAGGKKSDEDQGKKKNNASDEERFFSYLEHIPSTTCLLFYVRGKANGTRRLYKHFSKKGGLVSFERLDGSDLVKWIARELKAMNKQITKTDADQLIMTVGNDLTRLKTEISKVSAYVGEKQSVEAEDVAKICTPSTEYKVFDLADAVTEGNAARALSLMNGLLYDGEARLLLLALLQRQYRQLLFVLIMTQSSCSPDLMAKNLGVPLFVINKNKNLVRRYTVEELKKAYDLCIDTEYGIKSGQMSEEGALEQVVYALLAERSKGVRNA